MNNLPKSCSRCGRTYEELEGGPLILYGHKGSLCSDCSKIFQNEKDQDFLEFTGNKSIKRGVELILKGLNEEYGLEIEDQHFVDTPRRVARAYSEIFRGIKNTKQQVENILSTAFDSDQDEMIIVSGIHVFSMCPHHLLPVEYFVDVAYIPKGKVLGLSKIPRLVELLCKRPIIQEDVTTEIVKYLMTLNPLGAASRIEGQHFCMRMRGVNKPESTAITTSIAGAFKEAATRKEFMDHIKMGKRL